MINVETDLLPGQLSRKDKVPVSYSSPIGQFKGTGYTNMEPVYEKVSSQAEHFAVPSMYKMNNDFMEELRQFIYNQQPVYMFPTTENDDTLIGVRHVLTKIEALNQMIAYRNYEFVPLDDVDVQRIIRDQYNALQRNIKEPFMPLRVYDKNSGITIVSFKNGLLDQTVNEIYKVDIATAINIVQKQVKVPVNKRQLIALISLVFEVKGKRLYNSRFLNVLNNGHYNKVPTYFMNFSEMKLPNGDMSLNQDVYNRRLEEAELFSSILNAV